MRRELIAISAAALAALGPLSACKRESAPAKAAPGGAATPATGERGARALPPPLAGAAFYRVDLGPKTPCTADGTCEARLVLTALGDYKVNKQYPFKFIAAPAEGAAGAGAAVAVDGAGTFSFDDAKTGTLTLKYPAPKSAPARLSGVFKLSVCTDENCEISEAKIDVELPTG